MVNSVFRYFRLEFVQPELIVPLALTLLFVLTLGAFAWARKYRFISRYFTAPFGRTAVIRPGRHFADLFVFLLIVTGLGLLIVKSNLFYLKTVPDYEKIYLSVWVDVSQSSLAQDITREDEKGAKRLSRLDYQKEEIINLLKKLDKDYASLGAFAARAYPLIPPTLLAENKEMALEGFYRELARFDAERITGFPQGSNLGAVIYNATLNYRQPVHFGNKLVLPKRVVIILTDGERQGDPGALGNDLKTAIVSAKEKLGDTSFYIVGIGNHNKGSPIPSLQPGLKYEVDKEGKLIRTKPDWLFLNSIAGNLKGRFIPAKGGDELARALDGILSAERIYSSTKTTEAKFNGFWRWIAVALLLFLFLVHPFSAAGKK